MPNTPPQKFYLGPDQVNDLRLQRPYFLVPLLEHTPKDDAIAVRERILAWSSKAAGSVTDVFILSHGWHRNFFSAAAAYDKIVSAFSVLLYRARLPVPENFNPLILTLHWHSDPGDDQWEDPSGRRNKPSFLDNVTRVFERPPAADDQNLEPGQRFVTVFEDIFQLFAQMSVPGPGALTDSDIHEEATRLAPLLDRFPLRDAPAAGPADKVAAAWTCYCQALPKRVLRDQDEPPGRFLKLGAAIWTMLVFTFKVVGAAALLGFLFKPAWLVSIWDWLADQIPALKFTEEKFSTALAYLPSDWLALPFIGAFLFILSYFILKVVCADPPAHGDSTKQTGIWPARGASLYRVAAWLYLQVVCTVPLAVYLFFSYFCGWIALGRYCIPGLFDERLGRRNQVIKSRQRTMSWLSPRYFLALVAAWPLTLFRRLLTTDSQLLALVDELKNFLAFWEMQFLGVETGRRGADFLSALFEASARTPTDCLGKARVHFLGHSFGSLVIANAVRHLALDQHLWANPWSLTTERGEFHEKPKRKVHTLCLVQGAIASAWFEDERRMLDCLNGALACVYSRYDSANGFYYPLANHGRLAAGYVGLYSEDKKEEPYNLPVKGREDQDGLFASLTRPPKLLPLLDALQKARHTTNKPWIVNLDASRFIYEGAVATGGGHDDIFKDDLIHLLWGVIHL